MTAIADQIASVNVLNIDTDKSTISPHQLVGEPLLNRNNFIISDVDEEIVILLQFKTEVHLKSIRIYSLSDTISNIDVDASPPKQINIYKIHNLGVNFDDLSAIKCDKKVNCKPKKLNAGQNIDLTKTSKNAVKFKKIQYLAIYIKSNQLDSENTFINAVGLNYIPISSTKVNQKPTKNESRRLVPTSYIPYEQRRRYTTADRTIPIEASSQLTQMFRNKINKDDLSIFDNEQHTISSDCNDSGYQNCDSMRRLFVALKYYSTLDIVEKDREIFTNFINNKYQYSDFINDYIHFNHHHTHELNHMYRDVINDDSSFNKCQISSCTFTKRHHNIDTQQDDTDMDDSSKFYRQTMDSLHFYLFHCYDVGIRTDFIHQTEEEKDAKQQDRYFDSSFSTVLKMVTQKEHVTKAFDRFSRKRNDKFTLKVQKAAEPLVNYEDDATFSDAVYEHLSNKNVKNTYIKTLYDFISNEEYDTDTAAYDIQIKNGNIATHVGNDNCIQQIQNFVTTTELMSGTFNIGLRFYYWEYYKDLQELGWDEQVINLGQLRPINNYISHDGYKICDLFIVPRYSSFKEEISCYEYLNSKKYKESLLKVTKYMRANIVKKIEVPINLAYPCVHHYGIRWGDSMKLGYLLAIVLYCDYSDLCKDFSSSFRKTSRHDTLTNIKKRNSKYYWLSKYLREAVEGYGGCLESLDVNVRDQEHIKGPFYTGMDVLLHISEFDIRLCGPTSTSMKIEVAVKFSAEAGIVLQFNNYQWQYSRLRIFNVSWLSRYKEEEERLFFGGFLRVQIESVRIKNTRQNFEEFVHSLYYLDLALSGGQQMNIKATKHDISVITNLFSTFMNKGVAMQLDKYIYRSFAAYVQRKTQIVLDLHDLCEYGHKQITHLLVPSFHKRKLHDGDIEFVRSDTDCSNILSTKMLSIFRNVNTVIVKSTGEILENDHKYHSYSLSMILLLSSIETASLDKVVVKAETLGIKFRSNWIEGLWKWRHHRERITESYAKKK
eukprot:373956_1